MADHTKEWQSKIAIILNNLPQPKLTEHANQQAEIVKETVKDAIGMGGLNTNSGSIHHVPKESLQELTLKFAGKELAWMGRSLIQQLANNKFQELVSGGLVKGMVDAGRTAAGLEPKYVNKNTSKNWYENGYYHMEQAVAKMSPDDKKDISDLLKNEYFGDMLHAQLLSTYASNSVQYREVPKEHEMKKEAESLIDMAEQAGKHLTDILKGAKLREAATFSAGDKGKESTKNRQESGEIAAVKEKNGAGGIEKNAVAQTEKIGNQFLQQLNKKGTHKSKETEKIEKDKSQPIVEKQKNIPKG